MTTYLDGGWYVPGGGRALRTEVIDGAMDVSGTLMRSGIPPALLQRLALKVRSQINLGLNGAATFGDKERDRLAQHLEPYGDAAPELGSFIADCLDHVHGIKDLTAFYLHLVHITRMVQLLSIAALTPQAKALMKVAKGEFDDTQGKKGTKRKATKKKAKKKRAKKKKAKKKKAKKKKAKKKKAKRKKAKKKKAKKKKAKKKKAKKKKAKKKKAKKKKAKKKKAKKKKAKKKSSKKKTAKKKKAKKKKAKKKAAKKKARGQRKSARNER